MLGINKEIGGLKKFEDHEVNRSQFLIASVSATFLERFGCGKALKPRWRGTGLRAQAIQTAASTLVTMGLVVASADLDFSINDWLNLGFVKIAGQEGGCARERTKSNRYGRAIL